MPRISAEARSAAAMRAGGAPPEPPAGMTAAAGAVWRRIAASRPPDYFDDGAQVLLESLCNEVVHERRLVKQLEKLIKAGAWKDAKDFEKRLALSRQTKSTLCTKLRLSIQAVVDRHSRKLAERGLPTTEAPAASRLLGGAAVWGDKPN